MPIGLEITYHFYLEEIKRNVDLLADWGVYGDESWFELG